ncbi:MAG: hypothetical protein ACUZ8O_15720 [Candidatus Anammoxibacter sp.]
MKEKIDSIRSEHGLNVLKYTPSERVPVLLLGGFRSIAIDLLWIRGIAKHQEKKYYETMAINNLIAKLQPDFSKVWSFQAWNMAYNIQFECKAYATKWKWIKAGIDFAKEGAVKNPESSDIAFELGYMYLHLFSRKTFKHADYCRKRLYEEFNENNFVESVYWLKKAKQFESKNYNKSAMQRVICHAWWKAALQAEKDGRLKDAINYSTQSIGEWNSYLVDFPDDPMSKAKNFIPLIEQKMEEIKKKLNN